jgi:hypothetical protein
VTTAPAYGSLYDYSDFNRQVKVSDPSQLDTLFKQEKSILDKDGQMPQIKFKHYAKNWSMV